MSEKWFAFRAYNSQALYGFGTDEEAKAYGALVLNADREINVYGAYPLTDEEAAELRLTDNTEAFNLDEALQDSPEWLNA